MKYYTDSANCFPRTDNVRGLLGSARGRVRFLWVQPPPGLHSGGLSSACLWAGGLGRLPLSSAHFPALAEVSTTSATVF